MKTRIATLLLGIATFACVSILADTARAAQYEVLYSFAGSVQGDGSDPDGSLIVDSAGSLYGVTLLGGTANVGTVFELIRQPGGYQERVLYSFTNGPDGAGPSGGLIMDAAGNLYGVTQSGGTAGAGTVYKLTSDGNGHWTEAVLWSFPHGPGVAYPRGETPRGKLTLDAAGNLYGATMSGGGGCVSGSAPCGVIYKLSPPTGRKEKWQCKVLWRFGRFGGGWYPNGDMVLDASGNLYGTTQYGGNSGVVFKLSPGAPYWTETILHYFGGPTADGGLPSGGIVLDDAGNLYGATTAGGFDNSCIYQGCGTIFELSPTNGSWTEKLLYRFTGGADGAVPGYYPANVAGTNLALYGGNIYGTASYGGNQMGLSGAGVVYELSPSGDAWKQTVLHTFASSPDGKVPQSGVVADVDGNLYGTTVQGGDSDNGTVYKITPVRAAKE